MVHNLGASQFMDDAAFSEREVIKGLIKAFQPSGLSSGGGVNSQDNKSKDGGDRMVVDESLDGLSANLSISLELADEDERKEKLAQFELQEIMDDEHSSALVTAT